MLEEITYWQAGEMTHCQRDEQTYVSAFEASQWLGYDKASIRFKFQVPKVRSASDRIFARGLTHHV